jgi:hypothetical protein
LQSIKNKTKKSCLKTIKHKKRARSCQKNPQKLSKEPPKKLSKQLLRKAFKKAAKKCYQKRCQKSYQKELSAQLLAHIPSF